jgi:DNA polymerase-3 subunit epsilon
MSTSKSRTLALKRPLAILDLETTGVWPDYDRIVEIAILKVNPDETRTKFHKRVNPGIPIPVEATDVHGISDKDVSKEPRFGIIAEKVVHFLRGCDLAGFNLIRFDIPMLKHEFARTSIDFSIEGRRVVDACRIFHSKERRDLTAACRFFCGTDHDEAHSALRDARATWDVLTAQLARYEDLPLDLQGLHELCNEADERFVDAGASFVWRHRKAVLAFGKHRGTSLEDLARTDPSYLSWMVSQDFHPDTLRIVRDVLKGKVPKKDSSRRGGGEKHK